MQRATRLSSDCCSLIRELLVSSEDIDNIHPALCCLSKDWLSPNRHAPLTLPCLNVYIDVYFRCGSSSVDDEASSVKLFFVVLFLKLTALKCFQPISY